MTVSSVLLNGWAQRGKTLIGRLRDSFAAPLEVPQPSVWYAGLVIEPTAFSCQLARLQLSLRGANAAANSREVAAASRETTIGIRTRLVK